MTKDEKQCPFCAETIKKSAIKCRFCQSELTTSNKAKVTNTVSNKDDTGSKIGAFILLIAIFFIIRTCSISWHKEEQKVAEEKVDVIEELVSAPISAPYIDPEKLTSTFQFFSDYTDLQREKLERDLNGKVVIWELEVYDIKSTKDPKVFKIQTSDGTSKSESLGLAGVNKELDSQLGKLFQGWSDEINKGISGKKTNHSVGTWITLHTRNASDVSELESLKTGSWIKVKGRINGTFLRAINLNPAIIYRETEASAVIYKNDEQAPVELDSSRDDYTKQILHSIQIDKNDNVATSVNDNIFSSLNKSSINSCNKEIILPNGYTPRFIFKKNGKRGIVFWSNKLTELLYDTIDYDKNSKDKVWDIDLFKDKPEYFCILNNSTTVKFLENYAKCDQNLSCKVFNDEHKPQVRYINNEEMNTPENEKKQIIQEFYNFLSKGDAETAQKYLVSEKQNKGGYEVSKMKSFYSNMTDPIHLTSIESLEVNKFTITYKYKKNVTECNGKAIVEMQVDKSYGSYSISKINANC